jgi:hypothetical protein
MGSRRHLTSAAFGTAQSFASRNNDVDGWWAIGLLLAELGPGDQQYRIDLVSGEATPIISERGLGELGPAWAQYLRWSLAQHGLSLSQVERARLTLEFDRTIEVQSRFPGGPDRPFRCTVEIEDDRGGLHSASAEGHCGRLDDFPDPAPFQRPMRSAGPHEPVRILQRVARSTTRDLAQR